MKQIRVLISDDGLLLRSGLRALLQKMPELQVFAEGNNGEETARLINQYQPDMVWMEPSVPGANGSKRSAYVTNIRLLIISRDGNQMQPHGGAAGYLTKDASDSEVRMALNAVNSGETYLGLPTSLEVMWGSRSTLFELFSSREGSS